MKLVGEAAGGRSGAHSYNEVLPLMLARYCGPGLLGLGITALIAGFMSGMAGNVSAFVGVRVLLVEPVASMSPMSACDRRRGTRRGRG